MIPLRDIYCIGAAHWDTIAQTPVDLKVGEDVPGTVRESPGGVALNVATALARFGAQPVLVAAIGDDESGHALRRALEANGVNIGLLAKARGATDCYVAIEGANGLVAAVATADAVEGLRAVDMQALQLRAPRRVVVDSGLSPDLLQILAQAPWLAGADLRVTAASPAKATRLTPFLSRRNTVFYLNRAEASAICATPFPDSATAARALIAEGADRVLITDGARAASDADAATIITAQPRRAPQRRATGAGDIFTAAHFHAEMSGQPRRNALQFALNAASDHVATDTD